MLSRRAWLNSAWIAGLGLATGCRDTDGSVCGNDSIHDALAAVYRAFNAGAFDALIDAISPRFAVTDADATVRLDLDGRDAIVAALAGQRRRLGPIATPPGIGDYLKLGEKGPAIWLARFTPPSAPDGEAIELELRLAFSPEMKLDRLAFLGAYEGVPTRSVSAAEAKGDGKNINTAAAQQAYDLLARAGGGTLFFPAGRYLINLNMHSRLVDLAGAGPSATILQPATRGDAILRATYRIGSWDSVLVRDLQLQGFDMDRDIGFEAGHARYAKDDEYAGRSCFRRVRFDRLDKCISRPTGQIGLTVNDCQFEEANFHIHSVSGRNMHSGVVFIANSHMQRARKAVFYLNSPVAGSGQIAIRDSIMEANPGFVFFIKAINSVEAVPGMHVSNGWNELNATAATVTIDGRQMRPVYAMIENAPHIAFQDTPIGDLVLRNASVVTRASALDNIKALDSDPASTLDHHEGRCFGGKAPPGLTHSLAASFHSVAGAAPTFTLPLRTAYSKAFEGGVRLRETYENPVDLVGTVTRRTESRAGGVMPGQDVVQQVTLRPGDILYLPGVEIAAGRWMAWTHSYRLVGGDSVIFEVTGERGFSAQIALVGREWSTIGGVVHAERTVGDISLRHSARSPTSIQFAGSNIVLFERHQDAIAFMNSRLFAI